MAIGIAVAMGLVLPLLVFIYAAHLFLVVFAGLLLAVLLRAEADWLAGRTGVRPGFSLAAVILFLVALLAAAGWTFSAQISSQVDELARTAPQSYEAALDWLRQREWGRLLVGQLPEGDELELDRESMRAVTNVFSSAVSLVSSVLLLLFVGVYVAAEPDKYRRGFLHLLPLRSRDRANELLGHVAHALRWWLLAQFVSMSYLAVSVTILLWALDVPLALTLGLMVGLFTFVPYLGPILGYIPIALVSFSDDPTKGLLATGIYLLIQSSEGYFVTPMIQRKAVSLPPALTLTSEFLAAVFLGILGFILATPLLVVVMVTVQRLYVTWLGDDTFIQREAE